MFPCRTSHTSSVDDGGSGVGAEDDGGQFWAYVRRPRQLVCMTHVITLHSAVIQFLKLN